MGSTVSVPSSTGISQLGLSDAQPVPDVNPSTTSSLISTIPSSIPTLPTYTPWEIACQQYESQSAQPFPSVYLQSPAHLLEAVRRLVNNKAEKIPHITKRLYPDYQDFTRVYYPIIETFSNTATSVMPGSGAIWGTSQFVVKLWFGMQQMVETVVENLDKIYHKLPLFASYFKTFKDSESLQKSLVAVYGNIISFCAECFNTLRRKRARLGFQNRLDVAAKRVEESSDRVEKEAWAAFFSLCGPHGARFNLQRNSKHIAPARNVHFFCGKSRDNIFKDMAEELLSTELRQKSFSLHGFGGVGKTELAIEFVHRHQDAFPIILWFNADTPSKLAQSFSMAAQYLGLKGLDAPADSNDKDQVFNWLFHSEEEKWLLVYDNIEDIKLVQSYWPKCPTKGSILLTSQNPDTTYHSTHRGCSVGPMPTEEGADFLLSQLSVEMHSDADRVFANKISDILDGWSLALTTAAGVIRSGFWPLEDFERNLRESRTFDLEKAECTSLRYNKSIHMVWELAVSGLSPEAKNMFDLCAFYDSDRILECLVTSGTISEHGFPLPSSTEFPTSYEFYEAISELRQRSLVEKNERQLKVHRTLQAVAIRNIDPERSRLVFSTAVKMVAFKYPKHSPGQLHMAHLWMDCELYLPHVIALESRYKTSPTSLDPPPPEFAELLYNCSWYLMEKNRMDLAFALARTAQKLCEAPGGCKLILAGTCTVLGALHLDKNETKEAYACLNEARVLREEEVKNGRLAEYDPRLANSYSDLAASATALERYNEAVDLNHRSIEIRQMKPEIQIQMLSLTYHNLGTSLAKLGKVDEARVALEESLRISEERSDSSLQEHAISNDMRSLYALGNLHLDQGRLDKAFCYHEQALDLRQKTLGETHLMTGSSYHKLSSLYLKLGNPTRAREQVDKALGAFNQMPGTLGEQARTTYLLSNICRALNDPEAENFKIRAGELRKMHNGIEPDSQDTLADYDKLVIFFYR